MKRFLLVLVLVMFAGSVFAAELKITGDAMVRGTSKTYEKDVAGADAETAMYFDYDFNLNAALVANEKATVFLKLTYDKNVEGAGTVDDGDGTAANGSVLNVERAYINYKFAPFLQLNTGLMAGGQWATAFGNNEINVMRVQAIGALSKDMIFIATYQKDDENKIGLTNAIADKESQENNAYYLSSIMNFGAISVKPLLTYRTIGNGFKDPITLYAFTLGVDGDLGMIGFESEFVYTMVDIDVKSNGGTPIPMAFAGEDSVTAYGAYVNVWANLAPAKVGAAVAYTSSDEKSMASLNYGGDFDFTMIVDDMFWGSEDGLPGFTSFKLWAEAPVMEKLTLSGYFAYGMASDSKAMKFNGTLDEFLKAKLGVPTAVATPIGKDLSYWELNVTAAWAFDENTEYKLEGGYAALTNADGVKDLTDTSYVVRHRVTVKF